MYGTCRQFLETMGHWDMLIPPYIVVVPTDSPMKQHAPSRSNREMIEGDSCTVVEDGETMTPIAENALLRTSRWKRAIQTSQWIHKA